MPFNADTYRINQYRKKAWEELAAARDIKARAARGEAFDWEITRIATFARLARDSLRLAMGHERAVGRRPDLNRPR